MAEQTTIARPAPYLEAAGEKFVDLAAQLAGKPVDTAAFAPTIAGQNVLTQAAQQQAATQAGLGTLQFDPQLELYLVLAQELVLQVINHSYNKLLHIQDHKLINLLCHLINKK